MVKIPRICIFSPTYTHGVIVSMLISRLSICSSRGVRIMGCVWCLRISVVDGSFGRTANTEAGMHRDIIGSQKLGYSFNRRILSSLLTQTTAFFLTPWQEIESVHGLQPITTLCFFFLSRRRVTLWKPSSSTSYECAERWALLSESHFEFAAPSNVLLFTNFAAEQYDAGRFETISLLAEGTVIVSWEEVERVFNDADGSVCFVKEWAILLTRILTCCFRAVSSALTTDSSVL